MHTFCSSLTKFSSIKSVNTRFVAPKKLLIDTFLVIEVIISYDNFIAIDPMKKFVARFSFSAFQTPQMTSSCVAIVEIIIAFLNETTYSKIVM